MVHNFFGTCWHSFPFCVNKLSFMLVRKMQFIKWASLSKIPDVQKVKNVTFVDGAESKLLKIKILFGIASGAKITLIVVMKWVMKFICYQGQDCGV